MSSVTHCPRCAARVTVPDQANDQSWVRCRMCKAEYQLRDAIDHTPPELELLDRSSLSVAAMMNSNMYTNVTPSVSIAPDAPKEKDLDETVAFGFEDDSFPAAKPADIAEKIEVENLAEFESFDEPVAAEASTEKSAEAIEDEVFDFLDDEDGTSAKVLNEEGKDDELVGEMLMGEDYVSDNDLAEATSSDQNADDPFAMTADDEMNFGEAEPADDLQANEPMSSFMDDDDLAAETTANKAPVAKVTAMPAPGMPKGTVGTVPVMMPRKRKKRGIVSTMIGSVFGGLFAMIIVYYGVMMWGMSQDPLKIGKFLPEMMVPTSLRAKKPNPVPVTPVPGGLATNTSETDTPNPVEPGKQNDPQAGLPGDTPKDPSADPNALNTDPTPKAPDAFDPGKVTPPDATVDPFGQPPMPKETDPAPAPMGNTPSLDLPATTDKPKTEDKPATENPLDKPIVVDPGATLDPFGDKPAVDPKMEIPPVKEPMLSPMPTTPNPVTPDPAAPTPPVVTPDATKQPTAPMPATDPFAPAKPDEPAKTTEPPKTEPADESGADPFENPPMKPADEPMKPVATASKMEFLKGDKQYSPSDLETAVKSAKAVPDFTAVTDDKKKAAQVVFYQHLAQVGETAARLNGSEDPAKIEAEIKAASELLKEIAANDGKSSDGGLAAFWIDPNFTKRPNNGAFLAGEIQQSTAQGKLFVSQLQIVDKDGKTPKTIEVVSAAEIPKGRNVMLGSIVEKPVDTIPNYSGPDQRVIWISVLPAK